MILREAYESAYSIHPGSTKMYLDLKQKYWWYGLKRDVAEYVALCDTCQRVNATSEASWTVTTNEDSGMDMGRSGYGFYSGFTTNTERV